MSKPKTEGTCNLCGKQFSKGSMSRHLEACRKKHGQQAGGKQPAARSLHIIVEGSPFHWLHLEAAADATLEELDFLLRKTWLECCGHCSDFEIGQQRYSQAGEFGWDEFEDESMDKTLGAVLEKGTKFRHTYDYGSTTACQLRVSSEHELPMKKHEIKIEARNEPPEIPCDQCGKPAVKVCTECVWAGEGWLCGKCAREP